MTRTECRYCGRNAYHDGKCYADSRKGKPIEIYTYCDWAKKSKTTKNRKQMRTGNYKPKEMFNEGDAVLTSEQQKRLFELQQRHREKVSFYDSLSAEDRSGELGRLTLDEIDALRVVIWRKSHDLGVKSNLRFTRDEKKALIVGWIGGSIMAVAVFGLIIGIVMSV